MPTEPTTSQNTISGKIVVKETGIGIPDLLVVLYDLDSSSAYNNIINATMSSGSSEYGDRLGSVLTSTDGTWSLSYEDAAFGTDDPSEKRPDLFLMVMAPEDSDSTSAPAVLHRTKALRVNSGRSEAYIVRIAKQVLTDANIGTTADQEESSKTTEKIDKFRRAKTAQQALKEGMKEVIEEIDADENTDRQNRKDVLKSLIFANTAPQAGFYNFVAEDQSVKDVQDEVYD